MQANFCDPFTYHLHRPHQLRKENFAKYYAGIIKAKNNPDCVKLRCICERDWYNDKRPYYRIFPSILPLFLNIKLDIPCIDVIPPLKTLIIQLPNGTVKQDNFVLHNILVNRMTKKGETTPHTILHFYFHNGMDFGCEELIAPGFKNVNLELIVSQSQELEKLGCLVMPPNLMEKAIRYYATLCLIADDPELISPDVLNEDRDKWERTLDSKYLKRAKNRGKWGWNVGQYIEKSPHYRNGCLALYWTGEGKKIPKIRWRTGCVVHKEEILKIPQGHLDLEPVSV